MRVRAHFKKRGSRYISLVLRPLGRDAPGIAYSSLFFSSGWQGQIKRGDACGIASQGAQHQQNILVTTFFKMRADARISKKRKERSRGTRP
jgi:hypothetical protein